MNIQNNYKALIVGFNLTPQIIAVTSNISSTILVLDLDSCSFCSIGNKHELISYAEVEKHIQHLLQVSNNW